MESLLWLIPTIPFLSFLVLALFGIRMPKKAIAAFGVGSVGLSALLTIIIGINFLGSGTESIN